jgi:hypothetical protein
MVTMVFLEAPKKRLMRDKFAPFLFTYKIKYKTPPRHEMMFLSFPG